MVWNQSWQPHLLPLSFPITLPLCLPSYHETSCSLTPRHISLSKPAHALPPTVFLCASLIDYFWCNQFNYNLFYDVFLEPSMQNWLSPLWCSLTLCSYLSLLFSFLALLIFCLLIYYMILLPTLIYLIVVCYIVNQQSSNISGQKNLKEGAAETIYWTTTMYRPRTEKIVACQIDGTQCVS